MLRALYERLHHKVQASIAEHGWRRTLLRALQYPIVHPRFVAQRKFAERAAPEVIFERIHERNAWGDAESASGGGSTLAYTENLRAQLPVLFERFAITSVFDAPCGDFNWMREVVASTAIRYLGADIVPRLIEGNRVHTGERVSFEVANVAVDPFPAADLWICRDLFFHLSYRDIYASLRNFAASNVRYVLSTSHIAEGPLAFDNQDLVTGGFRRIDLFAAPFHLPREVAFQIDDWIEPFFPRRMYLWTREQVAAALPAFGRALGV